MMLTTKGRYAVMAMVDMAASCVENKPMTLAEIAERQEITIAYLEQIFSKLRKHGLVKSIKGPGGGYVLARCKEEILISDIIEATGEQMKMTRCNKHKNALSGCMGGRKQCLTHDLWDGLGEQIYKYLSGISLSDICGRQNPMMNKTMEQTINFI